MTSFSKVQHRRKLIIKTKKEEGGHIINYLFLPILNIRKTLHSEEVFQK